MAIQPAICASCGGSIKVDDVDLNGFCTCEFCGTASKVIDVITVDGLPTVKSLLQTADMLMTDGNREKAMATYKEVLKIKPNCHEAWWGCYLAQRSFDSYYGYRDKYGNSGAHTKAAIMNETLSKYGRRAVQYAPKDKKEQYMAVTAPEEDFIESLRSGKFDKKSGGGSGCYIATAVYGSYNCPEVVSLRRYRDDYLAERRWGRAFIRFYYRVSPFLAKHIDPHSRLGRSVRAFLDKKVKKLSL